MEKEIDLRGLSLSQVLGRAGELRLEIFKTRIPAFTVQMQSAATIFHFFRQTGRAFAVISASSSLRRR
jgi:hypothetical protein